MSNPIEAPHGIRIGPNNQQDPNDDRLPILDADEWAVNSNLGIMNANEVKVIELDGMPTIRPGSTIKVAPQNPELFNQMDLLIQHAHCTEGGKVRIIVRNLVNQERDFGSDQWAIQAIRFVNAE